MMNEIHELVSDYYGNHLEHSGDLKTNACCDATAVPAWLQPLLARIHPEVLSRYYGCGLVCPPLLEGCRILDLGCGSGRDVYALAQLAGKTGSVTGVDMTENQLQVAEKYREHHSRAFGFDNVRFVRGLIERLDELDLEPASFDVIVSNCVINLCPDKPAVFNGVRRLLKPGGEFYFSDIYSDRRVPGALKHDPVLYGECLAGALYWNDFISLAKQAGFQDPRLVEDRPLVITEPDVAVRTDGINFYSATCRLFNLDQLEPECEDYGQAVIYRGNIPDSSRLFILDKHHVMEPGRIFPVCGNTWRMLEETRYHAGFRFVGDFSRHYGQFPGCGGGLPFTRTLPVDSGESCC